jgi:hypothetical protein
MPRGARLDTPGTLHHVMVRGIERGAVVAAGKFWFIAKLLYN